MPRRTQIFQKIPWTGGVNTSVDPGVLPSNDLVQADNVVFTTSATRKKRDGFSYFDTDIPAVTHRSSSGTTRTLVFASSVSIVSPVDQILVVGEQIKVTGGPSTYNTSIGIIASVSGSTITYTFTGAAALTESSTADSAIVVSKNYDVLGVHDFWYFDSTNSAKQQYRLAVTSQGKIFRFDTNGRRKEITKSTIPSIPATVTRSSVGASRRLVFASNIELVFAPDDLITVASAGAAEYNTTAGTVTDVTGSTLTYTLPGNTTFTESSTAEVAAVVTQNTPWTATDLPILPITNCDIRTYNNKAVFSFSGLGNTPKFYNPMAEDNWRDLRGAPDGQYLQEHLGRLWMDDKTTLDRLHFSETFNEEAWLGRGDSGAIDISIGDGDPVGISAIMPPFRDQLFVAKSNRVVRITGGTPEEFLVNAVTNGIGAVSHKACVALDMDDLVYFSQRGVHSINTTQQFGDFVGRFLSQKIQETFRTWNHGAFKYIQGTYLSALNTLVWTVAEDGSTKANALWLFNPTIQGENGEMGVWFRWPNIAAQSVCSVFEDGVVRLLCGTTTGRLIIGQNTLYSDYVDQGIPYRIKTGTIYVDGNPQTIKGFKKFGLLFKPRGKFNFTAYFKVDNLPPQAMSFAQTSQGDKLGVDFVLGQSILGSDRALAPFMKDVDGYGRGVSIEVFQSGADAQVEIYGFIIEFESADTADEVVQEE